MTHLIRHADRPLRESMPTPDGFEALDRTHREVMDMLQQLQSLVEHLDAHGVDAQARESARAISSFFNDHARRHHADEETQVFPALLGSDQPDLVQHVRRRQPPGGGGGGGASETEQGARLAQDAAAEAAVTGT